MKFEVFGVFGMVLALVAASCSDDGGGGGNTGGSSSTGGSGNTGGSGTTGGSGGGGGCVLQDTNRMSTSAADACCLLCVAEDHCDPATTLDNCAGPDGYRKCPTQPTMPPECAKAMQAYFDCMRKAPDVCSEQPDPACDDEALAAGTVCPS